MRKEDGSADRPQSDLHPHWTVVGRNRGHGCDPQTKDAMSASKQTLSDDSVGGPSEPAPRFSGAPLSRAETVRPAAGSRYLELARHRTSLPPSWGVQPQSVRENSLLRMCHQQSDRENERRGEREVSIEC
jgi:hypothetical protein